MQTFGQVVGAIFEDTREEYFSVYTKSRVDLTMETVNHILHDFYLITGQGFVFNSDSTMFQADNPAFEFEGQLVIYHRKAD
jgi:hypothetical protein